MNNQFFLGKFGLKPDFFQKITAFVKHVNSSENKKHADPLETIESFIVDYKTKYNHVRLLSQPPMINFSDETISFVYEPVINRIVISKITLCGVIVIDPNNIDTLAKDLDATILTIK